MDQKKNRFARAHFLDQNWAPSICRGRPVCFATVQMFQNESEFCFKSLRDYSKITPRLLQDYSKITPRLRQDYAKIAPRLRQDNSRLRHAWAPMAPQ